MCWPFSWLPVTAQDCDLWLWRTVSNPGHSRWADRQKMLGGDRVWRCDWPEGGPVSITPDLREDPCPLAPTGKWTCVHQPRPQGGSVFLSPWSEGELVSISPWTESGPGSIIPWPEGGPVSIIPWSQGRPVSIIFSPEGGPLSIGPDHREDLCPSVPDLRVNLCPSVPDLRVNLCGSAPTGGWTHVHPPRLKAGHVSVSPDLKVDLCPSTFHVNSQNYQTREQLILTIGLLNKPNLR